MYKEDWEVVYVIIALFSLAAVLTFFSKSGFCA